MNRELHETAKTLAERALNRGFDAEAYICLNLAENALNEADRVPESNADEKIADLNCYFIKYMETKSNDDLTDMMIHVRQIISELYHCVDDVDQKTIFREQVSRFTNIIS